MKTQDCWEIVSKLISNREIEKAVAICESDPCSEQLECQRFLGWSHYGKGDMESALVWFTKAGNQQDGEALFGIGSVYIAKKDFQNALQYFERAADNGYVRSYQWIAGLFQHGCGVPTDIDKAISYYQKGAACGYIMAERSLINIASQNGNILIKLWSIWKLFLLQIKTAKIAYLNINDLRLADVDLQKKSN